MAYRESLPQRKFAVALCDLHLYWDAEGFCFLFSGFIFAVSLHRNWPTPFAFKRQSSIGFSLLPRFGANEGDLIYRWNWTKVFAGDTLLELETK